MRYLITYAYETNNSRDNRIPRYTSDLTPPGQEPDQAIAERFELQRHREFSDDEAQMRSGMTRLAVVSVVPIRVDEQVQCELTDKISGYILSL